MYIIFIFNNIMIDLNVFIKINIILTLIFLLLNNLMLFFFLLFNNGKIKNKKLMVIFTTFIVNKTLNLN